MEYPKSSIVNAPQSLQVMSGTSKNALEASESTLQSSTVALEVRDMFSSTGEGYRSDRMVCM